MSVRIYLDGNPVHDYVLKAMHEQVPGSKLCREYEESDVAVVFGVYKAAIKASYFRASVIARQQLKDRKVIVIDSGYVKRGDDKDSYYSVGLDGINGYGDHKNIGCPSDRWDALGVELKPMKEKGDHLICGQVPWDASLSGVNYIEWLYKAIDKYGEHGRYRPHPLFDYKVSGVKRSTETTIEEALEQARYVVAYNSNSLVDGYINGCAPLPGGFSMINRMVDRQQWANNLAYAQWRPDEMGEAFRRMTNG